MDKNNTSHKPFEPRGLEKGSQGNPISLNKAQWPLVVPERPYWVALAPLP